MGRIMKLRESYKKGPVWGHLIEIDLMALSVLVYYSPTEKHVHFVSPESSRKG